jgi:hypothetical protein
MSVAEYQPGTSEAHVSARDELRQLSPQALWEQLLAQDARPMTAKPAAPAPDSQSPAPSKSLERSRSLEPSRSPERSRSPEPPDPPGVDDWR